MFKDMKLATKILGGFLVVVSFTLVLGIITYVNTKSVIEDYDTIVEVLNPASNTAMEILKLLETQRYYVHAYMLEGLEEDRKGFDEASSEFDKYISQKTDAGKLKISDDQLKHLEIAGELHDKMITVAHTIMNGYEKKQLEAVTEKQMPVLEGFLTEMAKNMNELDQELEAELKQHSKEADEAWAGLIRIMIIMVLSCLIAGILLGIFITNSIVGPVNRVISSLSAGADQVTSASSQIAASGQELAQGASEQASSIEETSSSLEEMTSMVQQNAENARQASSMSEQTNKVANAGSEAVARMGNSILEIKKSSDETAKIIKTIDEIAFQTNLLALNAAVEAARAGEAGKGFAVVAEEVRNLAKRSAEAAKTTSELIANSQKNVENGVVVSNEVKKILLDISENVGKVSNLITEVSAASEEQARGIEQLNSAVAEMDKVTQRNSANAEESASASEELSSQSNELQDLVKVLNGIVSGGGATKMDEYAQTAAAKAKIAHSAAVLAAQRAPRISQSVHSILKGNGNEAKEKPEARLKTRKSAATAKHESIIPLSEDEMLKEF